MKIEFRLPKDHKVVKASIKPTGEFIFLDDQGAEIVPEYMERTIHYERPKGPKVQSNQKIPGELCTISGLSELDQYDSIMVIDTNTVEIKENTVSVACFLNCRLIPENDKFKVDAQGNLNFYEFHNVTGNPELLAIFKVATDIKASLNNSKKTRIVFVTDTELGLHNDINNQSAPLYEQHYLPEQFRLLYASADTGREILNRLIRACDHQASLYIKYLQKGEIKESELQPLAGVKGVKYRYMSRKDFEIINPVVGGLKIQEGSKISLYGIKE
jgi:hypothetical protein